MIGRLTRELSRVSDRVGNADDALISLRPDPDQSCLHFLSVRLHSPLSLQQTIVDQQGAFATAISRLNLAGLCPSLFETCSYYL